MTKSKGKGSYTVCGCGAWIYDRRIEGHPQCGCGKFWPKPRKPARNGGTARLRHHEPPTQSQTPPKPPKTPKIFRALEGVWKLLPDEARQEMTKVGFKPPAAAEPTAEESLLAMLQAHEAELPQEIRALVQTRVQGPPPSATEVEIKATNDLKGASGRLRDLGHKKIRLQGRIDEVKAVLTGLYGEMKDLLQELKEAEANMDALAQAFKAKVLQTPTSMEAEEFDCETALATIGVALDTTQSQKLQEAQAAHRQKQRQQAAEQALAQVGCPPGLGTQSGGPPGQELCQTAVAGTPWSPKVTSEVLQASLQESAPHMEIEDLEKGRETILAQLELKRRRIQQPQDKEGDSKPPGGGERSRSPKARAGGLLLGPSVGLLAGGGARPQAR